MKKHTAKALVSSLMLAVALTVFPIISGVMIAINKIDTIQGYIIQGAFMMLSLLIPVVFMRIRHITPRQIGFRRIEKGSWKIVLYFLPLVASKAGFLFFGANHDIHAVIALVFFTFAIGLSEEIYFRGLILKELETCFTAKKTVILTSVLFAAVHFAQAFSGSSLPMVLLSILNAFLFGIVAAEIAITTKSIIVIIIWHTLFDFVNWISLVQETGELVLIVIQSLIMIAYAVYLWTKLPNKHNHRI